MHILEIAKDIKVRGRYKPSFIIALSGFGGSGKSTIAEKLSQLLGDATVIRLDDFIINRLSKRSSDWEGFDYNRLFEQVLKPIQQGKIEIEYGLYDWQKNIVAKNKKVSLQRFIIVEGIGLIRPNLMPYFDCSVWVDVGLETAVERGKRRDREECKVDHDHLWDELWMPNDRDYFEEYSPKDKVDFILQN